MNGTSFGLPVSHSVLCGCCGIRGFIVYEQTYTRKSRKMMYILYREKENYNNSLDIV